jgi:putative flippase GtrA
VKNLIKKHAEKVRFAMVGVAATAIDWGILFALVALGSPSLPSNFVSTSVAMVFSFFSNKSFTFKATSVTKRRMFYFVAITVIGLWIIQPIIIEGVNLLMSPLANNKYIVLFLGKGLATVASLTWNYLMYKKFVFKKQS